MPSFPSLHGLGLLLLVTACNDGRPDTGAPDTTDELDGGCRFRAELSGAIQASLTGQADLFCALPIGADDDIETQFLVDHPELGSVTLRILEVHEGQTGSFDAVVGVRAGAGEPSFESQTCRVELRRHDFVRESQDGAFASKDYRVHGRGECADPLVARDPAAGSVQLGPFDFVSAAIWRAGLP